MEAIFSFKKGKGETIEKGLSKLMPNCKKINAQVVN
jgi:hypothetical protein